MTSNFLSSLSLLLACSLNAQDSQPNVEVSICRWHQGKQAAVTMRFDDAHPSHVATAAPMLDEYGLVGTFLINPGKRGFIDNLERWKAVVRRGHELGNHTMIHRGAKTDDEAEYEIGQCSRVLWEMQPEGSRLRAFARGGGTMWLQRKPMEYFLAKYDLFNAHGRSVSCKGDYNSQSVKRAMERLGEERKQGGWVQTHFHAVDRGHGIISSRALRQLCEVFDADDLWSAGMSAVEKYRRERDGASLIAHADGNDLLVVNLACSTRPSLYDHPLTLELSFPPSIPPEKISISDAAGQRVPSNVVVTNNGPVVRFDVPPIDAVFTAAAAGLGQAYRPQRGLDLKAPGPHPYVFFTADQIPELQAKATAPVASVLYEHAKNSVRRLVDRDPQSSRTPARASRPRRHASNAATLAFMHAVSGDRRYALKAISEIEATLAASTWAEGRANADLASANITCSLALCYDWMYDALADELRDRMRKDIIQRGLEPIFNSENRFWWTWTKGNWGSVIFSQAGVAAMTLLAEEPRAAQWVRICRQKICLFAEAIGADGGWGESVSYANYCWRMATMFIDALARATGGRDNLFDHPRLRQLPDYFTHLTLPGEIDFVPFSNYINNGATPGPFLYRFAAEYDSPQAQWIAAQGKLRHSVSSVLGFIWCDPKLQAVLPETLPTLKHFRTIDWAILRSRWNDPHATLFAFKGGDNEWDHYHNDHNSFALWSHGQPLLTQLGYPHQEWGVHTEAHNTIMVNGHEQAGKPRVSGRRGNPRHRTEIGQVVDTPWYAHLTGDASMAYDPDEVEGFVREVMYVRSEEDWIAHTFGQLSIDGNVVTVTQGEAAADVTVIAPGPFEHEISKKSFKEAGVSEPFPGAIADTFVKIRPKWDTNRARFLTVISPRWARDRYLLTIAPLNGPNVVGARISHGNAVDVALFTLNGPHAEEDKVKFDGRSCFVRRVDGRVTAFAIEQGRSLEVDGEPIIVSESGGQAVVSYLPARTDMRLNLYDSGDVTIHIPKRPVRCLADGRELGFEYDSKHHTMRARLRGIRRVRVELE
jgi:peptidoglycan/xylan/chitin deacetylase (PgdA/CDA1 family)